MVVPKFQQYEEGDAILKSELVDEEYLRNNYRNEEETETAKGDAVTVNNVTYPMPDEYYAIESPYEQLEYVNKFITTIDLGISMDEVEQKIATGELDVSLTESDKRLVDRREARQERYRLLDVGLPKMTPLSDKPPVKVSFLPDEGENAEPGWSRKRRQEYLKAMLGGVEQPEILKYLGLGDAEQPEILEYEDEIDDTWRPNDFSASPEFPSEQPGRQRLDPSKRAMEDFSPPSPSARSIETQGEEQVSPEESIKATFSQKLSPERMEKALRILTPYGPEEGLRRLQETDPEVARQIEQHGHHTDDAPPAR